MYISLLKIFLLNTLLNNSSKIQRNIFNKNINNKYKLIPFNLKENFVGETKYSPPASKEWKNSVYFFNYDNMKNLPIYDININTLIRGYFDLYFNNKIIRTKFKPSLIKRLSLNKIYVSKPEIKHTNSKAIITIYTYNREKKSLLKKIFLIKEMYSLKRFILRKLRLFTWMPSLIELLKKKRNTYNILKKKKNFIKIKKILNKLNLIFSGKNFWSFISKYESDTRYKYKKLIKLIFYKEFILIKRLKFKLYLNNIKFKEQFLYKLSKLISRYYKKKVEFNIISLKSFMLNTDIFTEILALKLKKNKINVMRFINILFKKAVIPDIIKEKGNLTKNVNFSLLENKYKNFNLASIINKNNLDEVLNGLYYNVIYSNENIGKKPLDRNYSKVKDILFKSIKYKNIGGIRLEVKGRLTKRYRADRAVFKRKWKGEFKNIDSYKGLSSVIYRGYTSPNIEYSMLRSKRRIGAFAVKGWISGK